MNATEFESFIGRLYAMFPSVAEYVRYNSPSMEDTNAAWFEILKKFALKDCESVLTEWINSASEPFSHSQRGMLPWLIRARILFHRDQLAKDEKAIAEAASVESRRRSYTPIVGLYDLYMVGIEASQLLDAGKISEAQYEEIKADLVRQAGIKGLSKIDNPIPRIVSRVEEKPASEWRRKRETVQD